MWPDGVCGGVWRRPGPDPKSEVQGAPRGQDEIFAEGGGASQEVTINGSDPAYQSGVFIFPRLIFREMAYRKMIIFLLI
jgi:hypothetical protein